MAFIKASKETIANKDKPREPRETLCLRISTLPEVLLVKVSGKDTVYNLYWSGHRLGRVGQLPSEDGRTRWGWRMEGSDSKGIGGGSRGAAVKALWKAWETEKGYDAVKHSMEPHEFDEYIAAKAQE